MVKSGPAVARRLGIFVGFGGMGGVGSLTRRCGWGESAIGGRAAGFRVWHWEGHWTRHRGGWRQQEGARHFALAAPVRLQTTQTGWGVRTGLTPSKWKKQCRIAPKKKEWGVAGSGECWKGNNQKDECLCCFCLWRGVFVFVCVLTSPQAQRGAVEELEK